MFLQGLRRKKEFITITVELLFLRQFLRFIPESCRIKCFGISILQSFQNHAGFSFVRVETNMISSSSHVQETCVLSYGSFCDRLLLIWKKILIQFTERLWMTLWKECTYQYLGIYSGSCQGVWNLELSWVVGCQVRLRQMKWLSKEISWPRHYFWYSFL